METSQFDEMILGLIERGAIKQMIDLPGCAFNRLLEIIRQKRAERPFFRYIDPDNPSCRDTPEG